MNTVVGAGPTGWAPDAATIAMVMIAAMVVITAKVVIAAVVTAMMAGVADTLRLIGPHRVVARRPLFPDGLEGTEFKGASVLSATF
jgi:hypothetical protein